MAQDYGLPGLPANFRGLLGQTFGAGVRAKKRSEFQGKHYFKYEIEYMGGALVLPVPNDQILEALPGIGSEPVIRGRLVQVFSKDMGPLLKFEMLECREKADK